MRTKRRRLVVEPLEQRQLLTATAWFEDTGQHLGANTQGADLGDLAGMATSMSLLAVETGLTGHAVPNHRSG